MTLPTFLRQFKAMFQQPTQQNTMYAHPQYAHHAHTQNKVAEFLWIAQWNDNSLAQHKGEIQLFLQQNKIDIPL
jgi:hypothetical protein